MASHNHGHGSETDEKGWHTLRGDLCQFSLADDVPPRQWMTVTIPYGLAKKVTKVQPFDPVKGVGEQRPRIDTHVRKLMRVMKKGEFTPSPWAAGVRDNHLKNLEIKSGRVTLRVNERTPLPLLDGGHRYEAIGDIYKEANGPLKQKVDALGITVLIHLDPKHSKPDFLHLQEGKPVNRSHLQMMKQHTGDIDPKKKPYVDLARGVALALNKTEGSFLQDEIRFTSGEGGRVEYASITTLGGSDIGTSLAGGAKIALYEGFRNFIPDAKAAQIFLVNCYLAAYQGIMDYDEKETFEDPNDGEKTTFPQLLMPGRMLRPTKLRGTKAGTGLLIMLGNMLAFRQLAVNHTTEIAPKDKKRLVEAARETLDLEISGGGSVTAKRQLSGDFVRNYFADVIRDDEHEHDLNRLGAIDGVPTLLCDHILTRSTLNVGRHSDDVPQEEPQEDVPTVPPGREEPVDTDPAFEDAVDFGEDEPEPEGKAKVRRRNRRKLREVMG